MHLPGVVNLVHIGGINMPDIFGRKSQLLGIWIAVGIGIVATTTGCDVIKRVLREPTPEEKAIRLANDFDDMVASNKRFGPLFTKLKTNFPTDYESLKSQAVRAVAAGATDEQQQAVGARFMEKFMHDHIGDMAAAPTENLHYVIKIQMTIIETLRASSEADCAAFVHPTPDHMKMFDGVAEDEIAQLAVAKLDAIIAGRNLPIIRPDLKRADQIAWFREMQHEGLTDVQTALLGNAKKTAAASAHDVCAAGYIASASAYNLPESISDRVIVSMIKSSG